MWVVDIDLISMYGPKMTWFTLRIELGLVLVCVVELDLITSKLV